MKLGIREEVWQQVADILHCLQKVDPARVPGSPAPDRLEEDQD